ncbi:translation initiation factor IF-2-like [Schistocerca gregaria]|uniref:translation initiation factor IF-2-like n=1 Tax=Schistocerca gregaria TaxID=7010 RepID=UPI00211EEC64|nr:translation initiation factor IF-2-like [Schistocerca gregaria]
MWPTAGRWPNLNYPPAGFACRRRSDLSAGDGRRTLPPCRPSAVRLNALFMAQPARWKYARRGAGSGCGAAAGRALAYSRRSHLIGQRGVAAARAHRPPETDSAGGSEARIGRAAAPACGRTALVTMSWVAATPHGERRSRLVWGGPGSIGSRRHYAAAPPEVPALGTAADGPPLVRPAAAECDAPPRPAPAAAPAPCAVMHATLRLPSGAVAPPLAGLPRRDADLPPDPN